LDAHSKKGVFFGYYRQSRAYLGYIPETGIVRRSRCVKCFDEQYFKELVPMEDNFVEDDDEYFLCSRDAADGHPDTPPPVDLLDP
jgi:hypothetical protein